MLVSEFLTKILKPVFGNGKRIWANAAPEDAEYPMLIYTENTSEKLNTIDKGFLGHGKNFVQLWVFAKDYAEVKRLKQEITDLLDAQSDMSSCIYQRDQYQFEEQTQSHLIVIDYSIWEQTT
jgi:hypothetical protein